MTGLQRGFEPQLLRLPPQLLQPFGVLAAGLPLLQVDERGSAPQCECVTERECGVLVASQRQQLAATRHRPLEHLAVDGVGGDDQPVALWRRHDGLGTEHLAQPDHAALQVLLPRRRRDAGPHRIGQALGAEYLAGVHREGRQHCPIT
jgi:hypothetical protein